MFIGNITEKIIGSSFNVMNILGHGFLESVYKKALAIELRKQGFIVEEEKCIQVFFFDECVGNFKADLVINKLIIVELKCCKGLLPEHQAQIINYLKASKLQTGLLINFGNKKVEVKRLFG